MMRINGKRAISMILALVMILSIVPISAFAQEVPAEQTTPSDWQTFLSDLLVLEGYAQDFAQANGGEDAVKLVINYIRTGVDRYLTDSWEILAGAENTAFTQYVSQQDAANGTTAGRLKDVGNLELPNGNVLDFGHVFGALNVSSYNNYAQVSTDFGSWAGDLCDLMGFTQGKLAAGDREAQIQEVLEKYLGVDDLVNDSFAYDDMYADLDCYYFVNQIKGGATSLHDLFAAYYTADLKDVTRVAYFVNNRFAGNVTQEELRNVIHTTYDGLAMIDVLEADRGLTNETELRYVCCYAFADYLYSVAKDSLVKPEPPVETEPEEPEKKPAYSVFSSTPSTLAPGITQTINYALNREDKQIVYYMSQVDITRGDVAIYANYNNNDGSSWGMSRVSEQMIAAQNKHSNPEDPANYIENYNAVLGVNASFYNMYTGQPSGLLVMEGTTFNGVGSNNFFAILDDGTPVIASASDYNTYASRIVEAVGGWNILAKDGVNLHDETSTSRGPRTVVGITADGKVILMVLDGRQEPFSAGATYYEAAQIMLDAGCVDVLELDGGGSATFDAKQEGSDHITVVNRPCDGYERNVSSSLLVVSTAKSSSDFHHAVISTATDYLTIGSSLELGITGVSSSGGSAQVPENITVRVSDDTVAAVSGTTVTALANGTVTVELVSDGEVVGSKELYVVVPDALAFTKEAMNVVYGVPTRVPLVATYQNNPVTIHVGDMENPGDCYMVMMNDAAGSFNGLEFIGNANSGVRTLMIGAQLVQDENVFAIMNLYLYDENEASFDFDTAQFGDTSLAWNREVSNASTMDGFVYYVEDPSQDSTVSYTFGLDIRAIQTPEKLMPLMEYLGSFAETDGSGTPWDYLLALAARVDKMTNVTIQVQIGENLDVDYSDVSLVNDYFALTSVSYDEETRILTAVCNWIEQGGKIEAQNANSVCIFSGLKVTPSAGTAGIVPVNISGSVTYDIYLRAGQLYSLALEPANQETYGLYPYVDAEDGTTGGHFMDPYKQFTDSLEISKTALSGWVTTGGNTYYYVDGNAVTGVQYVPSQEDANVFGYFDFGTDGVFLGKANGLFNLDGKFHYAVNGELKSGWRLVEVNGQDEYYFFSETDFAAVDGTQKIGNYTYRFENCILVCGQWIGDQHMWAGMLLANQWKTIEGKTYYFTAQWKTAKGYVPVKLEGTDIYGLYHFGDDGVLIERILGDGLFAAPTGTSFYLKNDCTEYFGLVVEYYDAEGNRLTGEEGAAKAVYYYVNSSFNVVKGKNYWVSKNNGLLPSTFYQFDANGQYIVSLVEEPKPTEPKPTEPGVTEPPEPVEKKNGIIEENGNLHYYVDGVKTYAGLVAEYYDADGNKLPSSEGAAKAVYYYFNSSLVGIRNQNYWVSKNNSLLPSTFYQFDANGQYIVTLN